MSQVGRHRRRHAHQRIVLVVALVGALWTHAIAVTATVALDLLDTWSDLIRAAPVAARPPGTPLDPSCDGDALLVAAARAAACATPFVADGSGCLVEVANRLEYDRMMCHVDELPSVNLALAPRMKIRELEQIDPEPLLDLIEPERQKQFEQQQEEQQVALEQEAERRRTVIERNDQIVEVARPTVELAPDDSRFLADYDSKVEKQTVARGTSAEEMVARSQSEALEAKANPREAANDKPPEPAPPGANPDAPRVPGVLSMRKPGTEQPSLESQEAHEKGLRRGSEAPIGDGLRARRGDGLVSSIERRRSEEPAGAGGAGGGVVPLPDLRPSEQVLERAIGGGSVDHLEDIESGEETALNTKQFVFATFFNRMKRRVHQNWDPVSVWARHDPTGQVYGFKTRFTRVRVTLSPAGELTKIIVSRSSGVDLLDDEAVRAFRAAQPFPNPPAGLVDATGNITFEFGFHLEIGGGRKAEWKIFRTL